MVSFDEMFIVINKTLGLVGLSGIYLKKSPYSARFNAAQYIFYIVGLIHMLPLMSGEVVYVIKMMIDESGSDEKFLTITELMPCFIVSFFSCIKSFTMVWKRKIIRDLVENFRIMWPDGMDPEINKIISQSMVPTKQFCWVYTVVTNVLSLVYNVFPLIVMLFTYLKHGKTTMLLPYYISYPFDWAKSPGIYAITYISQFYAGIFTTTAVSSVDCFFCLMVAHLCMHFQLLCRDIGKIPNTKSKGTKLENLIIHNRLKMAVIYHNKLIRLCRQVEAIFSLLLLLSLVSSSLMICMLTFSITVSPPARIVKYLLFLSSSMTQILMTSWYGNKLIEESNQVASAAYNSDWAGAECDEESRRTLCRGVLMLQTRASRQLAISAMGFSNISLSTFSSILSAAWSYFTLLRTVYLKTDKN